MTCMFVEWLPRFTRPEAVDVLLARLLLRAYCHEMKI